MEKDTVDNLLERGGVYKRLEERKPQLKETVTRLIDCYKCYHGNEMNQVNIEILQQLLWDILKMDKRIISFYVLNSDKTEGTADLKNFGGIFSKRITEYVLKDTIGQGLIKVNVNR